MVVDDHPIWRDGVRADLEASGRVEVVAKGYTDKEIADQLFLSTKTVQSHIQSILIKLQLSRRYERMRYAIRRGLDRT